MISTGISPILTESLDDKKWVSDNIITVIFKNIQQNINGCNVALVEPSTVQILRKAKDLDLDHVRSIVKSLELNEKDYIFFPVNNNNQLEGEGGTHWSLLVYSSVEKHRGFHHHDPMGRANINHAVELMEKLSNADASFIKKMNEVNCPRQVNGWDCGIYTLIYAGMLVEDIARGVDPMGINITPDEVANCRKTLRQKIGIEKALFEKDRKTKESKQDSVKQINNNNRKQIINHKPRNDNVCGRWINRKCQKGEDCTLKHPIMCYSDVYRTFCGSREKPCNRYHPQLCYTNSRGEVCTWGGWM